MTEFRRRLRYHQARWREGKGHPIGSQPIVPREGKPSRPVGSRLPLDYARETGANFVTASAHDAAKARTSTIEPHQTLDHQRLWAELLWSPTLGFNLFGDLAVDPALADGAVHAWWPDTPGVATEVRFAHSPGASILATSTASARSTQRSCSTSATERNAIVGVDTRYYDWTKPEKPRPDNMWRYLEVAERSGVFRPGATDALEARSELCVLWLEHLLVLSMLQHVSGAWTWGRYVVVHPAGNSDFAEACDRYRRLLSDESTFSSVTLEELLDAKALPEETTMALRDRYLLRQA